MLTFTTAGILETTFNPHVLKNCRSRSRAPGGNWRRHVESMQTPHREGPVCLAANYNTNCIQCSKRYFAYSSMQYLLNVSKRFLGLNSKHAKSPAVRVWKSWHRRIEERGRHLRPPSQWHSISVQFLMQIRPRWVNRHVHSYFYTILLFHVFIECRPLYLCVNSKEGHRSFNLHVKSSDMHAKRHALI